MDTIGEIMAAANLKPETLLEHKDNKYLRNFIEAAYIPEKKFNLPEGDPPYKENKAHEEQLRGTFWQMAKKIELFQRTDITAFRRESMFVNALEALPDSEAQLLIAAKEQSLPKMYKKLTFKNLQEVGYFA